MKMNILKGALLTVCVAIGAATAISTLKKTDVAEAVSNVEIEDLEIVDIAAGNNHNIALDSNGNLWAWGYNSNCQVGNNTTLYCKKPVKIGTTLGVKFSKITAGRIGSAALDESGHLYGLGTNYGILSTQNMIIPCLWSSTTQYYSLHANYSEYIYGSGPTDPWTPYGHFICDGSSSVVTVSSYSNNSNALRISADKLSYTTYRTKYSENEFITNKVTKPIKEADGSFYYYVNAPTTSGYFMSRQYYCVVFEDGSFQFKKTETNTYGSSYTGADKSTTLQRLKDVDLSSISNIKMNGCSFRAISPLDASAGLTTFYLNSEDGDVYSVGYNGGVNNLLGCSDFPESGYSSTPIKVELDAKIKKVSAGENHVIALTEDGKVYSWGDNSYGQLGTGDAVVRSLPTKISFLDEYKTLKVTAFYGETASGSFAQPGATNYTVDTACKKGTLTVDEETGDFTYVPMNGVSGEDKTTLTVNLGGTTYTYNVSIYINKKPAFITGEESIYVECGNTYKGQCSASDSDGDELTYSISQYPEKGTLVLTNNSGDYTYTAADDLAGGDSFTIAVSDGYCTVEYPVTVHINSLITANDDTNIVINLNESTKYTGNVHATDIDGDALSYSVLKNGVKGGVEIDLYGNYTYTPNGYAFGDDSFIIKINDGYKPLLVEYSVNLFSLSDNGTSLINKISKGTTYDGTIETSAKGVTPSFSLAEKPLKGTVSIDAETGKYTYIPDSGTTGDDYFTVKVSCDYSEYPITIHIYQNNAPTNASLTLKEDVAINSTLTSTLACLDFDGDVLSYALKRSPSKGSVIVDSVTGGYTYTPYQNQAGDDSFSVVVTDGLDCIEINVIIHIETKIETEENISITVGKNSSYSSQIMAIDKDGDSLSYSLSSNCSHGVVTVHEDGSYTYLPMVDYVGVDSFTVTVDDGVNPKNVTITVKVNRQPVAENQTIKLICNGSSVSGSVEVNDEDGDILSYIINEQPQQGVAVIDNANGNFIYSPNSGASGDDMFIVIISDGNEITTVEVIIHNESDIVLLEQDTSYKVSKGTSINGNVLATDSDGDILTYAAKTLPTMGKLTVNNATGSWSYEAFGDKTGDDSFAIVVMDGTNEKTITYTIRIDSPAVFKEDTFSFVVEQTGVYSGKATANDVDGDIITYSVVSQGSKGNVTIDPASGNYTYVPFEGKAGNDVFILGASDGNYTSEMVVNVHIESNIQVANGIIDLYVEKGATASTRIEAIDPDGDELTFSIYNEPKKGSANVSADGLVSYLSNYGAGIDTVVVSITDGRDIYYATIYVHVSSDPVFEESMITIDCPESGSVSGAVRGFDEDGDTLTYSVKSVPTGGTVSINSLSGEYTYKASTFNAKGTDSFVISATDGQKTAEVTVNVVINKAPKYNELSLSVRQGQSVDSKIQAWDEENETLTYRLTKLAKYGDVTLNESNGLFTYLSNDMTYSGNDSFIVTVSDGINEVPVAVSVTILKNSKPVGSMQHIEINSDSTYSGVFKATDADGDSLTYTITTQAEKGVAVIDENSGEFTYTSNKASYGYDSFIISVSDGYNSVSYLVDVNINYVDPDASWAIPTTATAGGVAALAIGACVVLVVLRFKKH